MIRKTAASVTILGLSVCVFLPVGFGIPAEESVQPGESAVNRVLSLDGEGDYMQVADSQSLHSFSNAITIEAWLKVSSFYAEDGYINSIIRKSITSRVKNCFLRFRNDAGKPVVEMSIGYDIEALRAPCEFTVGTWHHLAGTFDGSTMTIFANGVGIESNKVSGPPYIDKSDLFIGKGDPEFSFGEYFHGELDEIRIWNVARSPEEIKAAMSTPLTGKEDGLAAYWNFDDGTAKDLSGHGNDGVLNGDAQIVESPHPASLAPQEKPPDKLVAWWKFENNTDDSAGANTGVIGGGPTYVSGKFGQAISLDGNDYVDCGNPDSLNFGTGDWTISAWIKTTQSGRELTGDRRGTVFANGGDGEGGIRYALVVNEGYLGTIVLTTDNDRQKVQAMSKTIVNDDKWHHVIGMRNAGQLRVYVDGVLDETHYLPYDYDLSGVSQHNAYIGVITDNRNDSLYKYFVGSIDEVCVFACALDGKSVSALYSGRDPVKVAEEAKVVVEPPPRLLKPTDEYTRGVIVDDWQVISDKGETGVIKIRREADGTLSAFAVDDSPNGDSEIQPLDQITFENGILRFKVITEQVAFEGTMKEDGSTIEGQLQIQKEGQIMAFVLKRLKRIGAVTGQTAQTLQEQSQDRISGTSNIAATLIIILVLVGIVGVIVIFFVKSSIR